MKSVNKTNPGRVGNMSSFPLLDKCRIDANVVVEQPRTVLSLGGVPIATPGNLVTLKAQTGVGKTSFVMAMVAAHANPKSIHDTLGLESSACGGSLWLVKVKSITKASQLVRSAAHTKLS